MPEPGSYLLSNVGFSASEEPLLLLQKESTFIDWYPIGQKFTITFDMSERHCVGWRNITTGERFSCPDTASVPAKYEQCTVCQKRTGFNPAFYHANSVSSQQEARNQEPHLLYLAHFGPGTIKIGLSHAKRKNGRLLEQGARSAMILDTFPSAHIARQYEAKIATLPGIAETIQLQKKINVCMQPYDQTAAAIELAKTKDIIEKHLGTTFGGQKVRYYDAKYFPSSMPDMTMMFDTSKLNTIAGQCVGMLGALLICQQNDTPLLLPLKKYVGYSFTFGDAVTAITTPPQQSSLFSF